MGNLLLRISEKRSIDFFWRKRNFAFVIKINMGLDKYIGFFL